MWLLRACFIDCTEPFLVPLVFPNRVRSGAGWISRSVSALRQAYIVADVASTAQRHLRMNQIRFQVWSFQPGLSAKTRDCGGCA
jgi:hypothetical protein